MFVSTRDYFQNICQDFGICDKEGNPKIITEGRVREIALKADLCLSASPSGHPKVSYWTKFGNPIGRGCQRIARFFHKFLFRMEEAQKPTIQSLYEKVQSEICALQVKVGTEPEEKKRNYSTSLTHLSKVLIEMGAHAQVPAAESRRPPVKETVPVIVEPEINKAEEAARRAATTKAVDALTEGLREGEDFLTPSSPRKEEAVPPIALAVVAQEHLETKIEEPPAAVVHAEQKKGKSAEQVALEKLNEKGAENFQEAVTLLKGWSDGLIEGIRYRDTPAQRAFVDMFVAVRQHTKSSQSAIQPRTYLKTNAAGFFEPASQIGNKAIDISGVVERLTRIKGDSIQDLKKLPQEQKEFLKGLLADWSKRYDKFKKAHLSDTPIDTLQTAIAAFIREIG